MPIPGPISPTQSNALAALRSFLLAVLPGVSGQDSAVFKGSIAGTTLTVTGLPGLPAGGIQGSIAVNAPVLGAAPGTVVTAFGTGTGGVGTYQVNISQTTPAPATMATGVTVVAGQPNRSVEPNNPWFIVMTPTLGGRLGTNQDTSADVKFTGSMTNGVLTVSAIGIGSIAVPSTIFAPVVTPGTQITAQLTGAPGQPGTYAVTGLQTVSSETMSAGAKTMMMSAEQTVQLDFHTPDLTAWDIASTVSIALRDEFGTSFFSALAPPLNGVSPLHADDPRQAPFINAENSWEWRWVVDAHLQIDETISVPATYADTVTATITEVP